MRDLTLSGAKDGDNSDPDLELPIITDEKSPIAVYDGDIEEDLCRFGSIRDAESIIGRLSSPGKMPGPAFNLPASACRIGSFLKDNPNSVCSHCLAADEWEWRKQTALIEGHGPKRNNFIKLNVRRDNANRLHQLRHPFWVPAMVFVLRNQRFGCGIKWMRWFSSGDLQSPAHLKNIELVARYTPRTRHWMSTREQVIARQAEQPKNLVVRVSGHWIDGAPPKEFEQVSSVSRGDEPTHGGFRCPADKAGDYVCGNCRACWDPEVYHIDYPLH